ncbi:hypothetical protein [Vibrio aestuarianus]|uniref:Uncharacterized protein n=1 Tax=Vibrio aestuarianus TaxID=28171 RepID=A0ABM9FR84_9VIBR|nr:hypothetical protein [Vibrio aestuarianus]MDE1213791.1 hypothetical protein [Vibrio aestuarianus]MDE1217248.1 hypothetical protein [Vibrio aestuarianus]MDE1256989.1 hypothetical protein [Vibrio aestuarianus]MDE1260789.1 hypothetical protein [Vibrio aestuarianus]MDE1267585.1 hypothetical protein [Vibrio aestuarianus]
MSVAIQSFEAACHQPCPDMPHHSLNAAQKQKGLACLQRVRAELREKMLVPLRKQRAELVAKAGDEETSPIKRSLLMQEISRIDAKAQRIIDRWS